MAQRDLRQVNDGIPVSESIQLNKAYFFTDFEGNPDKINLIGDQYNNLFNKLSAAPEKDTARFIMKTFTYLHRKVLKKYDEYVSFDEMMLEHKYDCMTGTALFAILLSDLQIPFDILEYDHHVVLLVRLHDKNILVESTDPIHGVTTGEEDISRRLQEYRNTTAFINSKRQGREIELIDSPNENSITIPELAGLQYFNLAVRNFNSGDVQRAYELNLKASILYPRSERIQNFHKVLMGINPELLSLNF